MKNKPAEDRAGTMEKENAIEIRKMFKSFKVLKDKPKTMKEWIVRGGKKGSTHEVLKDINLDIKKGETVALIGTNGSGKSTLLKLMTKILYPNKGTVETRGKLTSLLELGAGFHPDFTGRENIYFNAAVFGLTRDEIEDRIDDIIEFSELENFIDEPVRTYSSGMYMRLAFAIAINVDAEIFLIDEILAVGDQHFQNKCFDKLEELRDSDKTVVIVSHSLSMMKILATRAVWLYKGEIRLDGDPTYVISQYLKQSAIDNQEEVKKLEETQEHKATGIVFIDTPSNFQTVLEDQPLTISGWSLANTPDAELSLTFDGKPYPYMPVPRPDVCEAYEEDYAGLMDPDTTGYQAIVPPELLTGYSHRIEIVLKKGDEVLDSRKIRIKTGTQQDVELAQTGG